MTETIHRTLKDEPYTFVRNRWGWGVCCQTSATDRFYRNYQVVVADNGNPLSCSCPQNHERHLTCKHMREVAKLVEEEKAATASPESAPVHYLNHPTKVRTYRFLPHATGVTVERGEGAFITERREMGLEAARRLYRFLESKVGYQRW